MSDLRCPICLGHGCRALPRQPEDYEYRVHTERPFTVYACIQCGSDFVWPRPSEAEIASFYPSNYHAYHDDHGAVAGLLVGLRARMRARLYRKLLDGSAGRLFDVGAGDCRHFDALKQHCDLEFGGVEIQDGVAAQARARGYDVATGTLESMNIAPHAGRYDIVSMYHLIEHVADPRLVLEKTAALLKPGGTVLGQLPSRTSWEAEIFGHYWGGYHFPRHLQAFSRAGLRHCLEAAGLVEISVSTAPHLQTSLSLQNACIGAFQWSPNMQFGKTPYYSLMLLAAAPFETLALVFDRGGIVNFSARKAH